MPFLSVIVPAFNVEGYVRQCLGSVLGQPGVDLEAIVVDDHSTDGTLGILEELAADDSRMRLIPLPENVGLGGARNRGLREASGEYVMFLDADDYLCDGALQRITGRCAATHADIVLFDYERVYWNNRRERNGRVDLLRRHPGTFALRDDPELLMLLNVAWNKAYRREFLLSSGLSFPDGFYEDIPWTYPLLCKASSMATLDAVCVAYRQRRKGSILSSVDQRHFDVLTQVQRLLDLADGDPQVGEFRSELWERGAAHALAVFAQGERRLPPSAQRDFLARASQLLKPQQPPGYSLLSGGSRKKVELLLAGRYRALRAALALGKLRGRERVPPGALRGKAGMAKRRFEAFAVTSTVSRELRPDLALFSSLWGRAPSGNPQAIARKLHQIAPDIEVVWAVKEEVVPALDPGTRHVVIGSPAFLRSALQATWLVNDVNFTDEVRRRPGQVYLQTQHGTPLKYMGLDLLDHPVGANGMDFTRLMDRVDQWSHNLSSNSFSSEVWARAFPSGYEMLEYGYPRNDILVEPPPGLRAEVRESLGVGDDEMLVLYLPTHRDGVAELQLGFDPLRFVEQAGPGVTLAVRGHYFYGPQLQRHATQRQGRIIDASGYPEVERLYLASDVLVTDYSSAMFDYANLGRPIVIYAHDWDRYRALRGAYFDITKDAPGDVTSSLPELVGVIQDRSCGAGSATEKLGRFQARFCEFDDGRAAERVVRSLFLGEPAPPVAKRFPTPTAPASLVVDRPG